MTDLTILIPTIGQRETLFLRLLTGLLPQLDAAGGRARVLAWRNNGTPHLGVIRDHLVRDADSEYVAFIDDDDLVPEWYVEEILTAIEQRPDHIGFRMEYSSNGGHPEIVEHSLRHGRWHRDHAGMLVRDFTHVDPIRRDIAMRGRFETRHPNRAEDRHWVKQVRPHLAGGVEVFIDRIMYYYLWDQSVSAWQRPEAILPKLGRPAIASPYFAWHPLSDD